MIVHNGVAFDTYIVLSNIPNWSRISDVIKNGEGMNSLKIFNGYVKLSEN